MKMILEVGSYHDNTPSQPSHRPKLTFTGFKTGFAPARASVCVGGLSDGPAGEASWLVVAVVWHSGSKCKRSSV